MLPPFEADGKRMPDDVWQYKCEKSSMKAIKLQLEGLTVPEIADEMGVARRTAYLYLQIAKRDLLSGKLSNVQIMELGQLTNPIDVQRKRLTKRLRKSDEVLGRAMEDYGKDDKYARNATKTALAINKGLGVLVDTAIVGVGEIDVLAKRREDQNARLEAMKQFGIKVEAEVVDSDDSPMSAARETGDNK